MKKMRTHPLKVTRETIQNGLNNFYSSKLLDNYQNWELTSELLKYAKKCKIDIKSHELEQARANFYHMIFDRTFRTLQRILYDIKFATRLNEEIIDLKTEQWIIHDPDEQKTAITRLIREFYVHYPELQPRFLKSLERLMEARDDVTPELQSTFGFYADNLQQLRFYLPFIMENVIKIWKNQRG